jgi:glutaredoxin
MLTLYTKPGCSFCAKVKEEGKFLGLTFNERSVLEEGVVDELVAKGGKKQVPFLFDDETDATLYGSDEIIAHLHKRFS